MNTNIDTESCLINSPKNISTMKKTEFNQNYFNNENCVIFF